MNSTDPHDKARDELAQAWYDRLAPDDKRKVDEWESRVYLTQKVNPQCGFSKRMAREVAFALVLYAVNEPKCARC
jgi:hypothetical protein